MTTAMLILGGLAYLVAVCLVGAVLYAHGKREAAQPPEVLE